MQVSVESGEGLERRMRVSLAAERFGQEVEKRIKEIARTARMPGFRPGKVPLSMLRRRYATQAQGEVFGELVESSFSEAVKQEGLKPAGRPQIEPDIDLQNNTYGYTATFEVLPLVQLAPLTDIEVKRPRAEVTEADLDAMLERLRHQRRTWNAVERPAQQGDQVRVSYKGFLEGESFQGGDGSHVPLEIGSGRMIEGFEEGLIGATAGEERTLELRFPDDYRVTSLAGKSVSFQVVVESVAEPVLPSVDEVFARGFGIEDGDLERLRRDVRQNMERELSQRIKTLVKNQVMDALIDANPLEAPKVLVQEEIGNLKQQARAELKVKGNFELPDNLFEDQARRRVVLGLIVGEIIKQHGLSVNPKRLRETVEDMASSYEDPQEVIDYYMSNRAQRASVESLVLEDQVVDWVLEQARVEEEPSTFQQLTAKQG